MSAARRVTNIFSKRLKIRVTPNTSNIWNGSAARSTRNISALTKPTSESGKPSGKAETFSSRIQKEQPQRFAGTTQIVNDNKTHPTTNRLLCGDSPHKYDNILLEVSLCQVYRATNLNLKKI